MSTMLYWTEQVAVQLNRANDGLDVGFVCPNRNQQEVGGSGHFNGNKVERNISHGRKGANLIGSAGNDSDTGTWIVAKHKH